MFSSCCSIENNTCVRADVACLWGVPMPSCRPNWEAAGAMLVDNVHAYEMMKVRVLNGGHSAISCGA